MATKDYGLRKQIGTNLKNLRTQNGLSQQQLADLLKIPRTSLANWEQGVSRLDIEIAIKSKKILNCTYEELLEGE